ncbi:hypothetical protein CPC08DRAFT_824544 [Agrocybe pediades]|nr:hypothetical protein CPC08DRAFT_824544 [Agrocybe pediades]
MVQALHDSGLQLALPPEIHELIIKELNGEDDALKQCALTCRLYRHLAQVLLFNSVVLQFLPGSNPAQKLLAILAQSPHIANYVRCLSLRGNTTGHGHWFTEVHTPVPEDNGIGEVLCALVNVTRLHIGGVRPLRTIFPPLSPASMAMIHSKCQSVLHLTVEYIFDVPWTLLTNSNSLESLELHNVEFPPVTSGQPEFKLQTIDFHVSFPHLKKISCSILYIDGVESVWPFMVQPTAHGGLESLYFNIDNAWLSPPPGDFQAVKAIIRNSAKSLKTVDVTLSMNVPVLLYNGEPMFNVSALPLLEEISLTGAILNSETDQNISPINLRWLSQHLETIPTSGKKFNRISLHSIIIGAYLVIKEEFDDESLKYFEDLVLNVLLPQTISLSVKFTIWGPYHTQRAETLIRQHLPALEARNLLEFFTESDAFLGLTF